MNASSSVSTSSSTPSNQDYFDLHIKGLGYLNRIREVPPKKGRRGQGFLACTIAALNGPKDQVEYKYFDCKVAGSDAQHLIRRCMQAVEEERKVLVGFCLGDPWIHTFTYEKGPKAGQPGFCHKARLLKVSWIKIDNVMVYPENAGNDYQGEPDPEDVAGPSNARAANSSEAASSTPVDVAA